MTPHIDVLADRSDATKLAIVRLLQLAEKFEQEQERAQAQQPMVANEQP